MNMTTVPSNQLKAMQQQLAEKDAEIVELNAVRQSDVDDYNIQRAELAAQELHIKQLREALEALNNYARERCCGLLIVDQALAIPTSTEHLEAWYREQVGEPVGHFYEVAEYSYNQCWPSDDEAMPLHAIKPFPFKGE